MKILIISFIVLSAEASIFDNIKSKVMGLIGSKSQKNEIQLPTIPKINQNAKDASRMKVASSEFVHEFYKGISIEQKKELSVGFINELYKVLLDRDPLYEELSGKLSVLTQGGSREGIYRSIVLGDQYRRYESTDTTPSDMAVKKMVSYMEYFLASGMNAEKLGQVNFYSAKRVIIEKTLELLEAFPIEDELFKWFAVFSYEMEKDQFVKWTQKHRMQGSKASYYTWAKSLPLDILKSEVILRLHIVLNQYQMRN